MATVTQLHTASLALLARPPLSGSALALLHGLADHAELLWFRDPDDAVSLAEATSEPDVVAFTEAADRLCELADIGAPRVHALLSELGLAWRHVPTCSLRTMSLALAEVTDRTYATLAARHVAWWFKQARVTKKQATSTWVELVNAALAWQPNDEICLRQEPFGWNSPITYDLRVSGFELLPIVSTQQLVDTVHHKGLLCSVGLAQACQRGEEAWFYARSVFGRAPLDLCLFGLTRACPDSPWQTKEAYAPPEYLDNLHKVALSVGARANARDRLATIRRNTTGAWSSVESLTSWEKTLKS